MSSVSTYRDSDSEDSEAQAELAAPAKPQRSTRPAALRKARSRFVRGTGRRKIGKQQREEAVQRRQEIVSGAACNLPSSVALKHWSGEDPELNDVQRALEREIFTDLTFMSHIFSNHHRNKDGTSNNDAHSIMRVNLCRSLERAMLDAEAHFLRRRHQRTVLPMHYHRRLVAGYAQLIDLWDAGGDKAWEHAESARILIFLGQRINRPLFRTRFGF
ncbi:hypothetical protein PENSPDRAFT_671484 [Peniophora sp. CONT]|nr:hypothetical protein PENSPDRAFT_671484 [Peniophora sp. CONT]